jgi:hypothetical protein
MFPSESLKPMVWTPWLYFRPSIRCHIQKNLLFIVTPWEPQISSELSWYVDKSSYTVISSTYLFSLVSVIIIISCFYFMYTHRNTKFTENVVQYFCLKWIMVMVKLSLCMAWRHMEEWRCCKDTKLSGHTQWVMHVCNVQLKNKVFTKINWWMIHEPPSAECHVTQNYLHILIYKMFVVFSSVWSTVHTAICIQRVKTITHSNIEILFAFWAFKSTAM